MHARGPTPPPLRPPAPGDDGVRVELRPRRGTARVAGLLALAALAALAAFVGWRWLDARGAAKADAGDAMAAHGGGDALPPAPASDAGPATTTAASARAGAGIRQPAADGEDPTPDLSDYVLPGEAPSMAEVIDGLHARGIRSGLGAFNPPGTSPPLVGLEVPEGFALPEGYVRHHQATDDGQAIAAILMFAPDFQLFDAAGRPLPMPRDRVVPPALAPPGMPLRRVRIPAARDGSTGP